MVRFKPQMAATLALLGSVPLIALAQSSPVPQSNSYPPPGSSGGASTNSRAGNAGVSDYRNFDLRFPAGDPNFSHRQLVARREDVHKHMVDNATRLLALTRELQEDLHLHEANDTDGKRLDDIAKLARAVREGMRQ